MSRLPIVLVSMWVKLQAGDAHRLKLWQKFIDVSIAHSEAIYKKLKVTSHEHIMPESAYNEDLPRGS